MRLWKKRTAQEAEEEANQTAPADEQVLPGSAGYQQGGTPDTTLSRFNFRRPDGKPEPKRGDRDREAQENSKSVERY